MRLTPRPTQDNTKPSSARCERPRRICGALQALALSPSDISGVLLTHEHTDHICGVATLTKQHRLPLYASRGTAEALCRKSSCVSDVLRVIPRAGAFDIGNARITVFPTSHDATESIDFRVDHDGAGVGILTDTGFVTPEAEQTLAGVEAAPRRWCWPI